MEPGWYPDPDDPSQDLYWNGYEWEDSSPAPLAQTNRPVYVGVAIGLLIGLAGLGLFFLFRGGDDGPEVATVDDESAAEQVEDAEATPEPEVTAEPEPEPTPEPTATPEPTPTPVIPTEPCTATATEVSGVQLFSESRQWSTNYLIDVCLDKDGNYWYHGALIDGDPATESITLAAEKSEDGVVTANNEGFVYTVGGGRIVLTGPDGGVQIDEALSDTEPVGLTNSAQLSTSGLGQIGIGMTVDQASRVARTEVTADVSELDAFGGLCYHVGLEGFPGVFLRAGGDGIDINNFESGRVNAIVVTSDAFQTPSGFRVGSTGEALKAEFGDQLEISPNEYNEDAEYIDFVAQNSNQILRFVTDENDVVTQMIAGDTAVARQVEGCG